MTTATTAEPAASGASAVRRRGRELAFGFIPALDGLRALAVLGVMCYHGGAPAFSGGFLTIDVFFVLSGFLITSLIVGEYHRIATIQLSKFWVRRVRRLLPALLVMIIGVALYARLLAAPGVFANLRLDSLASLFYVANWHFILAGSNYFNITAQPSPLDHVWSLSIEEQFYLVWPPVVLAMLHLGSRLRHALRLVPLLVVAVVGTLGSAIEMALLSNGPNSLMRVYEGTDTRAQDLLMGAALAVAMTIWAERRHVMGAGEAADLARRSQVRHPAAGPLEGRIGRRHHRTRRPFTLIEAWELGSPVTRTAWQTLGWVAVAGTAWAWNQVNGVGPFLLHGGYLLVCLAVVVVIVTAVTNQAGPLALVLSNPVFRFIGRISYGMYLWHFPLFEILDAGRMHVFGYPLLAIRTAATILVATASFYLVEEPIRTKRFRLLANWRGLATTAGSFVVVVAMVIVATVPLSNQYSGADVVAPNPLYEGPPVRVTILGDSVSETLAAVLIRHEQPYDVDIQNSGILGCGVVVSSAYRTTGSVYTPPAPCQSSTPADAQWPAVWQSRVDQFRPSVVVILAGRWEITDQEIGGTWQHIGEPAFDAALHADLERAFKVATSRGALVEAMTSPCFDSGEQPNGQAWPEDSPDRVALYNRMLGQVVQQFAPRAELFDLGAIMCPGGKYTNEIDGVEVRNPADGVHIPPLPATGAWYAAKVLPEVVRVGRLQQAGSDLSGRSGSPGA